MPRPPAEPPQPEDGLDALQGWLTLLPAAVLAAPLLVGSPTPVSAGVGWAALAALAPVLLLLFRRVELRIAGLVLLLVPLALTALGARSATDSFEAERALASGCTMLALVLSGASLGARGRSVLVRSTAALAVLWIAGAVLGTLADPRRAFAGVLENSGATAQAALPGGILGCLLFARDRGFGRWIGAAAGSGTALYVGLVPVHATAAGLVAAALVGLAAALARRRSAAAHAFLAALLVAAGTLGARQLLIDAAAERRESAAGIAARAADAQEVSASTGGFEVRRRIWSRLPAMAADHPWLGVGPGQFAAAFPPYRDPVEIELSTHGRRAPSAVEVEHAHNDWLLVPVELGLFGGLAWVLFLLLVLGRGLRAATREDPTLAGAGLVAIGVLVNAAAHAPLSANAAASSLAWAFFGVLCGRARASAAPSWRGLALPLLAAGALATQAPAALELARHGEALEGLAAAPVAEREGRAAQRVEDVAPHVERALRLRPDSVVALTKAAQIARARGAPEREQIALLERILALRPQHFEALVSLGNVHAREERFDRARELYERARALDPVHPGLLRNLLELSLAEGRADLAGQAVLELEREAGLEPDWVRRRGAHALLNGRVQLGLLLYSRLDPPWTPADGYQAWALAEQAEEELAEDALRCLAQLLWAREHRAAGRLGDAVRSYRQAFQISARHLEGGAPLLRLELAGALLLTQREAEAREVFGGLEPTPRQLVELPTWAGQELLEAGWILR